MQDYPDCVIDALARERLPPAGSCSEVQVLVPTKQRPIPVARPGTTNYLQLAVVTFDRIRLEDEYGTPHYVWACTKIERNASVERIAEADRSLRRSRGEVAE